MSFSEFTCLESQMKNEVGQISVGFQNERKRFLANRNARLI
jgi:hypothetical protein